VSRAVPPHELRATLFLALRRAGKLIRENIDRPKKILFKNKSPINLVTWVDQAADTLIRKTIRSAFPDHDLLTEESVPTAHGSPYKWIVDPLDGTTNFAHDYPQVCVSIALEYNPPPQPLSLHRERVAKGRVRVGPQVILGGVYDPMRDELFWAEKGRGSWLLQKNRKKRLTVSRTPQLSQALLLTGFPYDRRERIDLYLSYVRAFMTHIQGIRRAGAAALDLCWVACGRVDGYWEWRLKPWDVAAGKIIVEEAGGTLSDFSGQAFQLYGTQTLATNGRLHRQMLRVMAPLSR
jgi:myo-inositol-1(or 4)-monophosphatase